MARARATGRPGGHLKVTESQLRRIVYEAVAEARGKKKRRLKDDLLAADKRRGPDNHHVDPAYDLSRPPPRGGRMKRQGATSITPVLTSEDRARQIIRQAVREALRR